MLDKTDSGTFYICIASILMGIMWASFASPILKVTRVDYVLYTFSYKFSFDVPPSLSEKRSHEVQYLSDLQGGNLKRCMSASLFFFAVCQALSCAILGISLTRIMLNESVRIRTSLRMLAVGLVVNVVVWFSLVCTLVSKDLKYLVASGLYDGAEFPSIDKETSKSIRVGFFLSLTAFCLCLTPLVLIPWATN